MALYAAPVAAAPREVAVYVTDSVRAMDSGTCLTLEQAIRNNMASLTSSERSHVPASTAADGSDCHLRSGHTEHLVPNGASADWCSGFYPYIIGSVFGYWDAFVNHVNVGMCFNGYVAYKNWENCYTSVYIDLFGADQPSWCGVWNNNTYSTQPGDNFDWFLWGAPWVKYYGYLRKPVYGNGTSGATFGCITNGICM